MAYIEIIVDEFPVPVDEDEYLADPDGVREKVRTNRDQLAQSTEQTLSDLHPVAGDYDAYVAEHGEV